MVNNIKSDLIRLTSTQNCWSMANTQIDYPWGGKIGVPFNRVPQLGEISPDLLHSKSTLEKSQTARKYHS